MVTMIYYGKGINIPYDTQIFDPKDEISIMQQHCGGENLCVFSGFLEAGGSFFLNIVEKFGNFEIFEKNFEIHFFI